MRTDFEDADAFGVPHEEHVDIRIGASRPLSRRAMCSAVISVARANDLPIPFFANLIWQESSFDVKTISRAGALGVAQFMPQTANEYGLINPFEPIHALHTAGKFLRKLHGQFGNLGLAAAAYNAGPRRVTDWMAKRALLPGETRAYVIRITGREAELWTSSEFVHNPEATLMPAKAPCAEVAEAVQRQGKIVRVAKVMLELADATKPPPPPPPLPREKPNEYKFDEAAWKIATAKPEWQEHARNVVRGVLKNIRVQQAREAFAKATTKTAANIATKTASRAATQVAEAWSRIADRTMRKAAEEFAKPSVEKAENPSVGRRGPLRSTHVAASR